MRRRATWAQTAGMLLATASLTAAGPLRLDLGGRWTLRPADGTNEIAAAVPGTVHTDLLAAGRIDDPRLGNNAVACAWVGETAWTYVREFDVTGAVLSKRRVVLQCDGLDTVATLTLNGREIGRADNMFRTWAFDMKAALRPGRNTLAVTFTPANQAIADFIAEAKGTGPNTAYDGLSNIRKALYGNGWDFCPRLLTCGIYRPIALVAFDETRIERVLVDTTVPPGGPATVRVRATLATATPAAVRTRAMLTLAGQPVAEAASDERGVTLIVPDPKLWWPNGMGERPLYDLTVEAIDHRGRLLDTQTRRVGLRTIELLPKSEALPLRLRINGRDVFCRGANWVPADMLLPQATPQKVRRLLADAAAANMNTLRAWGGGAYEDDAFYDACDELGLLVWHDFKFACNAYPGRNPAFAENVRQEVAEQATRLSAHPSVAVWCGNNEVEAIVNRFGLMSHADYGHLFGDVIGGTLKTLLPNANYVTGSPDEGDEHNWWVWHIGADFEKYRQSHGLMTEFGFMAFPVPASVNAVTTPADRASVSSPVMRAQNHNGNGRGNAMILNQIARYFRPAKSFEGTLWLSQINQAYGLQMGIDHWRGDWPASSGALVWQLNDPAPATTWSVIDHFGRPKAAYYALKQSFAPVSVVGVYDEKTATLPVTICGDVNEAFDADVWWTITDVHGVELDQSSGRFHIPAGTSATAGPRLALRKWVDRAGPQDVLVWIDIFRGVNTPVASGMLMTVKPKQIPLEDPQLRCAVRPDGDAFAVELTATAAPALWAWARVSGDPDARFDENFVHLRRRRPVQLRVRPSKPTTAAALQERLVLRSLYDTAANEPAAFVFPLLGHP